MGVRAGLATALTVLAVLLGLGPSPSLDAIAPVAARTSSSRLPTTPHASGVLAEGLRPQAVAEQTTIGDGLALTTRADRHRRIAVSSSKGSRVWTASALAAHDVPAAALRAYRRAAAAVGSRCRLPWELLAGIGRVESDHGRYGGSTLGADGVPRPAIVGIALDGVGPVAAVRDTDGGRFDGDRVWDRAVGPMQFIPSTWRGAGRDGDGDGVRSPNDIDDASLAAAAYLCSGGGDLGDPSAVESAVFRYNPSDYYVALVTAFARGYRTGVFVIPAPEPDPAVAAAHVAASDRAASTARAARAATVRRAQAAHARAAARAREEASQTAREKARDQARDRARDRAKAGAGPTPSRPSPRPTPPPRPPPPPRPTPPPAPKPPALQTVSGPVVAAGPGAATIGPVRVTVAQLAAVLGQDLGQVQAVLDGLVASRAQATLTYYAQPAFRVVGFTAG
jgi:membrane-bound lytic murein transglycosylase B